MKTIETLKCGDVVEVHSNGSFFGEKRTLIGIGPNEEAYCIIKEITPLEKISRGGSVFIPWPKGTWRIPVEEKLIPFDLNDVDLLRGAWIKNKENEDELQINGLYMDSPFPISTAYEELSFKALLKEYTFLDGSPCGKKGE